MSEELENENKTLKEKITNLESEKRSLIDNNEGLSYQLDASKQMYNESINTVYQLRTTNVAITKLNAQLQNKVNQLESNLDRKNKELEEANATIFELKNPAIPHPDDAA